MPPATISAELEDAGQHREMARHDRGARELQEHEARRVVHEALALEDGHDLPRQAHAPRDGRGRDGVRRRDDGPEDESRRPRHARARARRPTAATASVVAMTRPTARSVIETMFVRKSRHDVK